MTTEKRKTIELISPKGVFVYPALTKPDYGTKAFPKPDGEYKVTLRVPTAVAEAWREGKLANLIAEAEKRADTEFAALAVGTRKKLKAVTFNACGTTEYDKATEEPTGFTLFKFAMKAGGLRKSDQTPWSQKPMIFDSKGVRLPSPPDIWGGSEGLISFEADTYFIPGTGAAGVSMRLKAVQLVKLVQGGQRDAAGFGFAAQDDGFDAADYQAPEPSFGAPGAAAGDPGIHPDEF